MNEGKGLTNTGLIIAALIIAVVGPLSAYITVRVIDYLWPPQTASSPAPAQSLIQSATPGIATDTLRATFLGQDGKIYAGRLCSAGTRANNVHIHLDGLRTDVDAISYRVEEHAGGGVWATPCNPVSNWLLFVTIPDPGQADLYFAAFREAPNGTEYMILIQYSDGTTQTATVIGTAVKP